MNFSHLVVSDLKNGIGKRLWYYIPAVLFACYTAGTVCLPGGSQEMPGEATFSVAVFECFQGMSILNFIEEVYFTPPFFLLLHSWLILLVSSYAYHDMKERGPVVFTRCGRKDFWWFAKCIWVFVSAVLYYVIIWLVNFIIIWRFGKAAFYMPESWWSGYYLSLQGVPELKAIILYFFLLPCITSAALAMVQLFLSVCVTPVAGVLAQLSVLFVSLCFCNQWLPGNYFMLRRTEVFTPDGIHFLPAFLFDVCLIVFSMIGGIAVLRKKDIF